MSIAQLKVSLVAGCAMALALLAPSSASALSFYGSSELVPIYNANASGTVGANGLDAGLSTKVVITNAANVSVLNTDIAAGPTNYSSPPINGLGPGFTLRIYQPQGAGLPVDSFTMPPASLNAAVGASAITGEIPSGWFGGVQGGYNCVLGGTGVKLDAGPFSAPVRTLIPGATAVMAISDAEGNSVSYMTKAAGESPCVFVYGSSISERPPGTPVAQPYGISVYGLLAGIAPTTRVVIARGGASYFDSSSPTPNVFGNFSQRPLAGDVVSIFRPAGAAAPSFTYTLPEAKAVFDPAANRVDVTAPAAGMIAVRACRPPTCFAGNTRTVGDRPAGLSSFDFSIPAGSNAARTLRATDLVSATWTNSDDVLSFEFDATLGDLLPPTQKLSIASKLRLGSLIKAFKKGLKVKLTSNEAGKADVSLTLGKTKLATAKNVSTKAGTTTVKLKFTKSGKKALAKFKKQGRKFKSQKATLTSVITDAAGNAQTTVKRTTLKR